MNLASKLWGAAFALAVIAMACEPAAAATPLGKNLVKNPGAEAGATGTSVPDWEIEPDFSVVPYGEPGVPSEKQGKRVDGESQLFSTGEYILNFDTCGSARQSIKLKKISDDIDSGSVRVTVSAAMGTEEKSATAFVILQFRDSNNHQVGSNLSLSASTSGKMVKKSKSKTVPAGTRAINVLLQGDLLNQTCDGFFDNVSVILE